MQYYQQQLDVMLDALMRESFSPSQNMGDTFKRSRLNACRKALSQLNLFVPAKGAFRYSSSNDTFTIYSKPLNRDVIVLGCGLMNYDTPHANRIFGEFRLRLPEPLEHLSQNYIFSNQAFAAATYSVFFPSPFILPASEQIAIDFGWNAPQAELETLAANENEIVLFCVAVKDCLSSEDLDILGECERVIRDTDYQRRILLNAYTPGSVAKTPLTGSNFLSQKENMIIFTPDNTAGVLTTGITREADTPLIVIGIALSGCASTVRLTDLGTGHAFTTGDFILSDQLFYPDEDLGEQILQTYFSYFRLPVPHMLKTGASLFAELINGGNGAVPVDTNPRFLMWECITP